jgi:hypothetical protein
VPHEIPSAIEVFLFVQFDILTVSERLTKFIAQENVFKKLIKRN